jgi:ABC-2 type transport system ATP-binding protein
MPALETEQLERRYGRRRGIVDVNLSVAAGEVFGFLGPNGAGKTTTIRILMGLMRASKGTARVFGRDCWYDGPAVRADIGYVPGDVRLYPWLTVRRALQMVGHVRRRSLMEPGLELAERFGIEPDLPFRKMSRGNRQKVALLLALTPAPPLLILDEPTAGLDPLMQATLCTCLRDLSAKGHTVFFSSHTLSEVENLCHRVAIVREGRIVEDRSVAELRARAPRQVTIRLPRGAHESSIEWPEGLQVKFCEAVESIDGARICRLELRGSAMELIHWTAVQPFTDVTIEAPSLESLFHQYYSASHRGN